MALTGETLAGGFDVGIIGLGVMGSCFARNLAGKGFSAAGYDRNPQMVSAFGIAASGLPAVGFGSIPAFVSALRLPRRVILLVPAGQPVDDALAELLPHLSPGDTVLDCGNSFFEDTRRRETGLAAHGIAFMGVGISGGEEGALHGPSIMAGGDEKAWALVGNMLETAAATAENEPCCARVGPDGAGHFVKMVHNGIEYADMQLIAESYFLLKTLLKMRTDEIADVFAEWNRGPLRSYLIEITGRVLLRKDGDGEPLVDRILDAAGQKGTGMWTARAALQLGVPAPSMAEAVFARALSAEKEMRLAAAKLLPGGTDASVLSAGNRPQWIETLGSALYAFKICVYAQGFALLRAASQQYGWALDLGAVAKIWRGGCIIRADFLNRIAELYAAQPDPPSLLFAPYFRQALTAALPACRRVVAAAALNGIPAPCFASALSYYDGLRAAVLPANLIQAQRDYFGAHTYRRLDRPGVFHTEWEAPDVL